MNTFLPYSDFTQSAKVLDNKRLNNQLNECKVLYAALTGQDKAWASHPATVMWEGHAPSLFRYSTAIALELDARGINGVGRLHDFHVVSKAGPDPAWLGVSEFHLWHQRNLVRKNATYYQTIFAVEPGDIYVWPKLVAGQWVFRTKQVGAKSYGTDYVR